MSIESENFAEPEKKYPTAQDLQDLEIKVDGLGRGDIIHEGKHHIGILRRILAKASQDGWEDYLLQSWKEETTEINKLVAQVRLDKAKEKGLL